MTPEYIEEVRQHSRELSQNVQAEGYAAAKAGKGRDAPYSPSQWQHNHWLYGYMLGLHDKRMEDRNARG